MIKIHYCNHTTSLETTQHKNFISKLIHVVVSIASLCICMCLFIIVNLRENSSQCSMLHFDRVPRGKISIVKR